MTAPRTPRCRHMCVSSFLQAVFPVFFASRVQVPSDVSLAGPAVTSHFPGCGERTGGFPLVWLCGNSRSSWGSPECPPHEALCVLRRRGLKSVLGDWTVLPASQSCWWSALGVAPNLHAGPSARGEAEACGPGGPRRCRLQDGSAPAAPGTLPPQQEPSSEICFPLCTCILQLLPSFHFSWVSSLFCSSSFLSFSGIKNSRRGLTFLPST